MDVQKAIDELATALRQSRTNEEMKDLLRGLLTMGELEEIARRLQIVKLLKSGMPQREIAKTLDVGIATVTRGSREVKQGRFSQV